MKNKIEPPLWRQILGTVLVTSLLVAIFFIAKPAFGDETSGNTNSSVSPRMPADPPFTPHKGAHKFRHHKLGTAKGWKIPAHLKNKINKKYAGSSKARASGDHWWDFPFTTSQCIYWTGRVWNCAYINGSKAGASLEKDMKHVKYVAEGCSLGAFVGHYIYKVWDPAYQTWKITRHGWLAIGAGASACTWEVIYNKWWSGK